MNPAAVLIVNPATGDRRVISWTSFIESNLDTLATDPDVWSLAAGKPIHFATSGLLIYPLHLPTNCPAEAKSVAVRIPDAVSFILR